MPTPDSAEPEEDGPERTPSDDLPGVHPKHLAADRAGKGMLRAAHDITVGLAAAGVDDDGVVVLRRGGPHRSLAGLEALLDAALADDEATDTATHSDSDSDSDSQ
jgi:hypothetical protein